MGKKRTNTESDRSLVGHLQIEDRATIEPCCSSLKTSSEIRLDETHQKDELCSKEVGDEESRNGAAKKKVNGWKKCFYCNHLGRLCAR